MKGKTTKAKKPDNPLRMKASDFDRMKRQALSVKPVPQAKEPAKKKARKKR